MIKSLSSDFLDALQREAFDYFVHEANPLNGLIADKTQAGSPASIAAVGFALSSYPVGVERGFMTSGGRDRANARDLALFQRQRSERRRRRDRIQRLLLPFPRHGERKAGLEMRTVDDRHRDPHCRHVDCRRLLLRRRRRTSAKSEHWPTRSTCRADWNWAQNGGVTVTLGWKPESGFLRYRWQGYCEAMVVYLLGLGSPTHPLPVESWARWTSTYEWRKIYDHELLYAGPLFIHQFSHIWIDFRGIQDDYMRDKRIDYFENSRRATHVHRQYAIANPARYEGYGENSWGITASDGPGPATLCDQRRKEALLRLQSSRRA